MNFRLPHFTWRTGVLAGIVVLAILVQVAGWWYFLAAHLRIGMQDILLAGFLAGAIVVSYRYPINIRLHVKIQMSTVAFYLLAVLLPPPVAASVAGIGILVAEVSVQARSQNLASDIAVQGARYILSVLLASLVAHVPLHGTSMHALLLIAAALLLFASDMLTFALQMFVFFDEPFRKILRTCVRDMWLAEGAQYILGILGTFAVAQEPLSLFLLVVPIGILYFSCKYVKEMNESTGHLLESMADTVDLRDPYTGGHSRRVTKYTAMLLKELNLYGPEVDMIITAARVHDIGKIGIPDSILNKAGPLNPEERAMMETHPDRGAELLVRYPDFARGTEIVRHHHESWDGNGYPARLKGLDIPFGARVLAVADTFDAMTSDRPYRKGMPVEKAASILSDGRGKQWDAEHVDAFLRSILAQPPQTIPLKEPLSQPVTPVRETADLVASVPA
ncbi:MAG: HD-GYP domain-containing protein [Chloroflexota bacterium]|nr:HD-GYP domain-containing protein [Chloroflexota bacterium]